MEDASLLVLHDICRQHFKDGPLGCSKAHIRASSSQGRYYLHCRKRNDRSALRLARDDNRNSQTPETAVGLHHKPDARPRPRGGFGWCILVASRLRPPLQACFDQLRSRARLRDARWSTRRLAAARTACGPVMAPAGRFTGLAWVHNSRKFCARVLRTSRRRELSVIHLTGKRQAQNATARASAATNAATIDTPRPFRDRFPTSESRRRVCSSLASCTTTASLNRAGGAVVIINL